MDWLAQDEVREAALEPWAREAAEPLEESVRIAAEGVVVRSSAARWSAIPWEQVLAVARAEGRAFVLVPRRPPAPPWFEVSPAIADRIASSLAERRAARAEGYRSARARTEPPPPDEIRRRVLARDDVPGAIEVPLGIPKPSWMGPTAIGGVLGASFALQLIADSVLVAGIVGGSAAILFGGALHLGMWRRYARRPRILVMTPDAYVAGLDGDAVRAIPWDRVAAFREGSVMDRPAIEVVDREGRVVARTEARLFGIDRGVLIALAEAYRARAMSEMGRA